MEMRKAGVLMKRIKLHTMYGKKEKIGLKWILLGVMSFMLFSNIFGCSAGSREEYLSNTNRTDKQQAEEMMQEIINALEARDAEAIKELFSSYALENAYDLDGRIEELMDFYPGSNGGYEGNVRTHETTDYGDKIYVLMAKYTVTNDDETYQMRLTMETENDVNPEKVGLYMIQVMTEEAKPEGFKWKDEEDEPGIYVLE